MSRIYIKISTPRDISLGVLPFVIEYKGGS